MKYGHLVLLATVFLIPVNVAKVHGAESVADMPFGSVEDLNYNIPIEVNAEQLDYDKEKGRIIASGGVKIVYGEDSLIADKVMVNTESGDALALGNVVIKRMGMRDVTGSKVTYNFKTRTSSIDDPVIHLDPFHSTADKVTRTGKNEYILSNARVTTCIKPYPHCHYSLKAKKVTVVPDQYIKTKGAVLSLGKVPVFYIPYWRHSLNRDSGFNFFPGYRNRMGFMLLSSYYHHPMGPNLKFEHHVDYYSERGFGLGEDWTWKTSDRNGKLRLYYINDDDPMNGITLPQGYTIDSQRYRISLEHNQSLGPRTSLISKGSYLSDLRILDDYFNKEYRSERQPENYVSISHRNNLMTLTALANVRLNDFYSNINRLPEVSLNVNRSQIGNSTFYYESYTAGALLEKVWEDYYPDKQDYSTARFDTSHMIYQPRKYLGWLNLVPRAGIRGTYYSATKLSSTTTNITTVAGTNSFASGITQTNVVTGISDGPAKLRGVFEIGSEISFKAFRTFSGGTKRHIVEPYANYTYSVDPNVDARELYQFDQVDTLEEQNNIMIGVRNKIQNKVNGHPNNLADINTWTTIDFSADDGEDAFDKLYLDSDFYPASWIFINLYGHYSVANSALEEFNTRVNINRRDSWSFHLEHRYRDEESNLLNGNLTVYPSSRWALSLFGRYEFEESRIEEEGGYIEHRVDCIGMRLGGSVLPAYTRDDGSEEEADYRIILSVWLTAFPDLGVNTF